MIAIYHITHVANLASILEAGGLLCESEASRRGLTAVDIGYSHIKERRARRRVAVASGGTLNDYVPFYFGPRSPMLYTIWRGNVPQYEGAQGDIVHLVADAEAVAAAGIAYAYTDGHAVMEISDFFDDLEHIATRVDFNLMLARYWNDTDEQPDRARRRQAEFLVYGTYPWALVERIGVESAAVRDRVQAALEGATHQPPVDVRPEWYY